MVVKRNLHRIFYEELRLPDQYRNPDESSSPLSLLEQVRKPAKAIRVDSGESGSDIASKPPESVKPQKRSSVLVPFMDDPKSQLVESSKKTPAPSKQNADEPDDDEDDEGEEEASPPQAPVREDPFAQIRNMGEDHLFQAEINKVVREGVKPVASSPYQPAQPVRTVPQYNPWKNIEYSRALPPPVQPAVEVSPASIPVWVHVLWILGAIVLCIVLGFIAILVWRKMDSKNMNVNKRKKKRWQLHPDEEPMLQHNHPLYPQTLMHNHPPHQLPPPLLHTHPPNQPPPPLQHTHPPYVYPPSQRLPQQQLYFPDYQ